MRLLLDECLPRALAREFASHDVRTVQEEGWAGVANGRLLELAAGAGFEVLLTVDRGIEFQQNVSRFKVAVLAFRARRNTIDDLRPLAAAAQALLPGLQPGTLTRVPE